MRAPHQCLSFFMGCPISPIWTSHSEPNFVKWKAMTQKVPWRAGCQISRAIATRPWKLVWESDDFHCLKISAKSHYLLHFSLQCHLRDSCVEHETFPSQLAHPLMRLRSERNSECFVPPSESACLSTRLPKKARLFEENLSYCSPWLQCSRNVLISRYDKERHNAFLAHFGGRLILRVQLIPRSYQNFGTACQCAIHRRRDCTAPGVPISAKFDDAFMQLLPAPTLPEGSVAHVHYVWHACESCAVLLQLSFWWAVRTWKGNPWSSCKRHDLKHCLTWRSEKAIDACIDQKMSFLCQLGTNRWKWNVRNVNRCTITPSSFLLRVFAGICADFVGLKAKLCDQSPNDLSCVDKFLQTLIDSCSVCLSKGN